MRKIEDLRYILSRTQKIYLIILFVMLIIGMGLEIIGLGAIIPLLTVILDPNKLSNYLIKYNFDFLLNYSKNELILFTLIIICVVYFLKSIYLVTLNYSLNKYTSNLVSFLSTKLFNNILRSEYAYHLKNQASDSIKLLQIEVNHFNAYFSSLLSLIVEIFLCLSILIMLVFIEPIGSTIVFMFITSMGLVLDIVSKNMLEKWSFIRQEYDKKLTSLYINGIQSIRDIKIYCKELFFIKSVTIENQKKASISTKQMTLKQIPRYYLEFVSIIALTILIFYISKSGKDTDELITITSLYVAATFRILPSINKILQSLQSIKFYSNSVDNILIGLKLIPNKAKENSNFHFKASINLNSLSYKYPSSKDYVLKNITLEFKKNTTIGIIGTTGSGKSTLVDLVTGLIKPSKGLIQIDNKFDVFQNSNWKSNLGYITQNVNLFNLTIAENIAFGTDKKNIDELKIHRLLKMVDLYDFVISKDDGIYSILDEKGKNLSGGQIQRLAIARALYHDPQVLILDEATSALDVKTENKILNTISTFHNKKTIIIITHRPSALKYCDSIYEVKDKNLIQI